MNQYLKKIALVSVGVMFSAAVSSVLAAQNGAAKLDVSKDGIFSALTSSNDLQATVDQLMAAGADRRDVVAIAGAAGIAQDRVEGLQVCTNSVSADATVLGATCMRVRSLLSAYQTGSQDPLNYLPATAAGNKATSEKAKK